jgi:hypothetical protein
MNDMPRAANIINSYLKPDRTTYGYLNYKPSHQAYKNTTVSKDNSSYHNKTLGTNTKPINGISKKMSGNPIETVQKGSVSGSKYASITHSTKDKVSEIPGTGNPWNPIKTILYPR